VENHEQIKILYTAASADESQVRTIEPREIKVLNGHTYVRAYCTTREAWRTFRVDRINAIVAKSPATKSAPPTTSSTGSPRSARRATRSSW
jgi:proteasome accessory factor C